MECVLIADTGSGELEQYKVAKSMERLIHKNPKISAIIAAGDNIYPHGCISVDDPEFTEKFKKPYKNIKLPFYLCLGNHDYGTNLMNTSQIQIDYTYSSNNTNRKWNLPKRWYSQEFSHCDFFFIDTNFYAMSQSEINQQLKDTIQSIHNSNKKWKILCGHHTWRSVGGHGNAEPDHETFMDKLLSKTKIDLYVCGHDHCKSLIQVGKHKIPTLVIGTGGKSYDESYFYPDNMNYDSSILDFFSPNLGICHMKCNNKSLSLTCYNEKLQKEYHYAMKK